MIFYLNTKQSLDYLMFFSTHFYIYVVNFHLTNHLDNFHEFLHNFHYWYWVHLFMKLYYYIMHLLHFSTCDFLYFTIFYYNNDFNRFSTNHFVIYFDTVNSDFWISVCHFFFFDFFSNLVNYSSRIQFLDNDSHSWVYNTDYYFKHSNIMCLN